ncbi:MAG: Holliday junction resolvase RecU [Erysipelotrichaceae bacterium]|nr:Holliday junction resolvase RecU [Erysipelotrichaceae bacterium]
MVNYPNGKKHIEKVVKTSFGNRGMTLEKDLNASNSYFLRENIANIHKKPTPIQIVNVDYPKRSAAKITEAYFKVASTTDYNGVYRAKAIDFEAKECASKSFPLNSIHLHQIQHLQNVLQHGAIAFVIIRFTKLDATFYVKADDIINIYLNKEKSKKSIPYSWFVENCYIIPYNLLVPVNYIKIIDYLYF